MLTRNQIFWLSMAGFLLGLSAPFVVPFLLPFARWASFGNRPASESVGIVGFGWLPAWCRWYQTPDVPLPGDLTVPDVARIYGTYGRFWCAWNWLGVRNRAAGFDFQFAVAMAAPWPPEPGYYADSATGLWWERKPIFGGRLQLKRGWRSRLVNGQWYGVPCYTITKA